MVPKALMRVEFVIADWKHGQANMRIIKTELQEALPDVSVFLE